MIVSIKINKQAGLELENNIYLKEYYGFGWCTLGILYNSSASVNQQSTGFPKMFMIFSLFNKLYYVKNALNY